MDDRRQLLSTLWIFVLLHMVFRDLHQFGNQAFVADMLRGEANGIKITEGLMVVGWLMIEIPLMMVLLSKYLPPKPNAYANGFAALFTLLILLSGLATADLDDWFFTVVEASSLLYIISIARKLVRNQAMHRNTEATQDHLDSGLEKP